MLQRPGFSWRTAGASRPLTVDGQAFDISCGQIYIGNARTDLVVNLEKKRSADLLDPLPSIFHMANLPPEANVQSMMIMASKMPYVGRG